MDSTSTRVAWSRVCAVADVPSGEATTLEVDPPIAVFNVDGEFHAIDDTCTHDTYSLADSYIDGCEVECALHFARFDLKTGAALCLPATLGVRTYPVKIDGDDVFVDVGSRGDAAS